MTESMTETRWTVVTRPSNRHQYRPTMFVGTWHEASAEATRITTEDGIETAYVTVDDTTAPGGPNMRPVKIRHTDESRAALLALAYPPAEAPVLSCGVTGCTEPAAGSARFIAPFAGCINACITHLRDAAEDTLYAAHLRNLIPADTLTRAARRWVNARDFDTDTTCLTDAEVWDLIDYAFSEDDGSFDAEIDTGVVVADPALPSRTDRFIVAHATGFAAAAQRIL